MKKLSSIVLAIFGILLIVGANFWLVFPWFMAKGPADIGSIEVSYVSMIKFLVNFSPHLSFAPYWYFGFPFHLFYTPLVPVLGAWLHSIGGLDFWPAYRLVSGTGFILVPVTLFLFTWTLTKRVMAGIMAALAYTFLPSLFYFILPSGEVAQDVITQGWYDPRRVVILARWGEGPHTVSLVFLSLAGLFFDKLLKTKKPFFIVLTALFAGLTALTNAVGLYGLFLLLLAVFFARIARRKTSFKRTLKITILTALVTYGLVAFWYNLSFISTFFGESGGALQNYLNLFPWGFVLAIVLIIGLYYLYRYAVKNHALRVSLLWFFITFLIVYVYYASAPPELSFQRIELAPQALRLTTEVDMALAVLIASLWSGLVVFLEKKGKILGFVGNIIGLGAIFGLFYYGSLYLPYGQTALSGEIDLKSTTEFKVAKWLEERADPKLGERVFVAGNYGFYLNYFSDVWQLRGGLYQAQTHPWPGHIYYQLTNGENGDLAESWLKIANVKYVVVNTVDSPELYKEFKYPEKFANLKTLYKEDGDIIYEVPLVGSSPVKVVNLGFLKNYQPPKKGDDKDPVMAYAGWLDQSLPGRLETVNNNQYQISADVTSGKGVLVQMTYDKGFKASSDLGGQVKVRKDPLGFIILLPEKTGEQVITLTRGSTADVYLGYFITVMTLVIIFVNLCRRILFSSRKKPS